MRKIPWRQYRQMSKDAQSKFVGVLCNKENEALCYETGEERKYKLALAKRKKEVAQFLN